jgi:transcriptional regulator with XRE-family HTH domain
MDTPAGESIGERLRRLRLDRGLSQRELSSPGVSYAYISRIEAGARRPSVKALRKLARKLNVSPEYLETGSPMSDSDLRELRLVDAELALRLTDDVAEAEAMLIAVLNDAVQAGDESVAMRARIALGLSASRRSDHGEAVVLLEGALDAGTVSPAMRPDLYLTLGRSYAALGAPGRAVELFEQCLEELGDVSENSAARIRFDRAQEILRGALDDAAAVDDVFSRIRLYWSMARLAEMQDNPEALDYARRAIALLEVTEDTVNLGQAHLLCAIILMDRGENDEAAPHLAKAEQLFALHADAHDLAALRNEQARHAARMGRFDEAVDRAREALDLLGDTNPAQQGDAWAALGEAYGGKGDVTAADDAFRKATDLLAVHGAQRVCSEAFRSWARLLRKAGRESEALDVLDRAAELASRPNSEVSNSR